ncbi:serine/threonine-protein phosphatase 6 catalytic subunit-like protein, partial [Leptotrombidium deliense]
VFCVHGGLSTKINTLDQVRTLENIQEIPYKEAF